MIKSLVDYVKKPERRAVGVMFLAISTLFGAWVTRLPEVKMQLGLSEAELGIALFFLPLGAISLLPFYGAIIAKLGERGTTLLGILGFILVILFPILATNLFWLSAGLYMVGLGMGLTDVAMNAVAAEVEKQFECQIMSVSHGFFSLGGMIGAASAGLFISAGFSPFMHLVTWSVIMAVLILISGRHLVNAREREVEGKRFQLPPRAMWVLALISFCVMMSEGGITDWSAVYMREDLLASAEVAGLGYAGFSGFMALMRFMGDGLIGRFGAKRLLVSGVAIAIVGLGITLIGDVVSGIIGFSLAGIGFSAVFPILFGASSRVEGVTPAVGIASVASAGYVGLLLGPVVIGFVAEEVGLAGGFVFLMGLSVFTILLSLKSP